MKRPPGPAPTNCKTCHHSWAGTRINRKKKCDKVRPSCGRCTQGGYTCLGYQLGDASRTRRHSAHPREDLSVSAEADISWFFESVSPQATINDESQETTPRFTSRRTEMTQIFPSSLALPRRHLNPARPPNGPRICETNTIQPYRKSPIDEFLLDIDDLEGSDEDKESLYPICDALDQIALVRRAHICMDTDHIRGRFATRIVSSEITRCSLYIGAQMFRTLRHDREHTDVERFVPLLDRLAQLSMVHIDDLSLDDLVGRLSGALEITFLKHLTTSAMTGYSLLRTVAHLFMQVAFADPTLWLRDPSSSGISLAHVFASPFYDLGRFVFIDATTSMMFGTSPLVEYDTSHPITRSDGLYPSDWIRDCPHQGFRKGGYNGL